MQLKIHSVTTVAVWPLGKNNVCKAFLNIMNKIHQFHLKCVKWDIIQ
jgi:hypothetical protein